MKIFYPLRELTFRLIASLLLIGGLLPALKAQLTIDMPGAVETQVTGINNSWDIVGWFTDGDGLTTGFYMVHGDTLFYNYNDYNTWFGGVNNNGKIVGRYNPSGDIADFHAFIWDVVANTVTDIPGLDGHEYMSPNDINDNDVISGDMKNGANRRFFIYDENGLNSQNFILNGEPMPTYGGHGIDNLGSITGWYLDGGNYIALRYNPDLGFVNEIDLLDPEFPNSHKTRLMGSNNNGKAVLDFITSDNAHIYEFGNTENWVNLEKFIPGSAEIHLLDVNDSNSVCGYYMDANYVVHGFADIVFESDFDIMQNGNSFINQTDPVWPPDIFPELYYQYDHYWTDLNIHPFPDSHPGYLFYAGSYPSWPDYVSMMSSSSCYYNVPNFGEQFTEEPVMRPHAFASWKMQRSDEFKGACFGMSCNAGASWQFPDVLYNKFIEPWDNSEFGGWDNLYIRGENAITPANMAQAGQASQEYVAINAAASDLTADTIINIIARALMGATEVPVIAATLTGNALIAGHALFPYGITKFEAPNEYAILVYDPNDPGNNNVYIKVVYDANYGTWTFLFGDQETNAQVYGLRLMYARNLYDEHLLPGMTEVSPEDGLSAEVVRDEEVRLFTIDPTTFAISSSDGIINVSDDLYENTIPGAEPWLWYGGLDIIPNQFSLPTGDYTLTTPENDNLFFTGGMRNGNTTIMYNRYGTLAGQEDIIQSSGTALTYLNNIGETTDVVAQVFTQDGDAEFFYEITDLTLEADQSVTLEYTAPYLYITNSGAATEYDVTIQIMDEVSGLFETLAANVNLGDGITQEIIPVFDENGITGISITEFDEDPNTENIIFTVENSGVPELVLGMDSLIVFPAGGANNLAVANFGAGTLEWNVLSSPSWISISQSSGINYGTVEFSVEANDFDTRDGLLIVQNINNTSETDTLYIQQIGALGVIDDNNLSQHIQLWPNPTHGNVYLKKAAHLSGKQMSYDLISSDGKLVGSGSFNNDQVSIDLRALPTGLYQIRLNADGVLITKRVMVE